MIREADPVLLLKKHLYIILTSKHFQEAGNHLYTANETIKISDYFLTVSGSF